MIDRFCNRHKERTALPRGCSTCVRLALEADIVKMTVDALLVAGYALHVAENDDLPAPTTSRDVILGVLGETDDEHLMASRDGKRSWVYFVYGNDGWDVISDYTVDLEDVLKPVSEFCDAQA
jgi:hypothetical protein